MTGYSYWEASPRIEQALISHFPRADASQIREWTEEIYNSWSASEGLERIERSDRPSSKDINSLREAERALRKACEALADVGWHGGKALEEVVVSYKKRTHPAGWPIGTTILGAPKFIEGQLSELADRIKSARLTIPTDAPSVNSAFGDGPEFGRPRGRPRRTAARFTADACRKAFQSLSGLEPTVRTNWNSNEAYGPFLEFVTAIFAALGETASPETWARAVTS